MPELPIEAASIFCEGLDHPECVAVHPDGSVWCGGEAGQIYRITPDGRSFEVVASTGGFVLGIAFSPDASWLAVCDLRHRCIWRLDLPSRTLRRFAAGVPGHDFGVPNMPAFDREGSLYVTDSGAFRQVSGCLLRFEPGEEGDGAVWHHGPFNFANGIALSPGEDALYVVCSWLPGVERVEIRSDGTAGRRELFVSLPRTVPDGIAFDRAGYLYISCYAPSRIYRVSPSGKAEVFMDDWEAHTLSNPTNLAFAGPEFDRLLVANLGRWHLTQIPAPVPGLPLPCHAAPDPA